LDAGRLGVTKIVSWLNSKLPIQKEFIYGDRSNMPRLGILDFNPIQYHSPLYQRLARCGNVALDVLFISDYGYKEYIDIEFGVSLSWDIDLLSGYNHKFLAAEGQPIRKIDAAGSLVRWIRQHDTIVIHGYSNPWMLFTAFVCRSQRIPYLIRGDSTPVGQSTGLRSYLRSIVAHTVVSNSAGGLSIGQLNSRFYQRYKAPNIFFAPYSVDDERFSRIPAVERSDLLAKWNLGNSRPVILFSGKLYPGKRPLDIIEAIKLLTIEVTTIFVGDGIQADEIRDALAPGDGIVTGFVNQSEIPSYYHAADILVLPSEVEKWGLVINEAMAAGVVPVVSDRVGAAPDLVLGVGEVYPCGNIAHLAEALIRALELIKNPNIRGQMKAHAARYSLERTAVGFEQATLTLMRERRGSSTQMSS
jgi:glycosyltransferase involved in cell wall biosynthesis